MFSRFFRLFLMAMDVVENVDSARLASDAEYREKLVIGFRNKDSVAADFTVRDALDHMQQAA